MQQPVPPSPAVTTQAAQQPPAPAVTEAQPSGNKAAATEGAPTEDPGARQGHQSRQSIIDEYMVTARKLFANEGMSEQYMTFVVEGLVDMAMPAIRLAELERDRDYEGSEDEDNGPQAAALQAGPASTSEAAPANTTGTTTNTVAAHAATPPAAGNKEEENLEALLHTAISQPPQVTINADGTMCNAAVPEQTAPAAANISDALRKQVAHAAYMRFWRSVAKSYSIVNLSSPGDICLNINYIILYVYISMSSNYRI